MTYYPQRTNTDCLIAATECLLQKPREEFGVELSYYHRVGVLGGDYWTYGSMAATLALAGYQGEMMDVFANTGNHPLTCTHKPGILGLCFEGHSGFHAVYYDGQRLWDGHNKAFVLGMHRVVYAIWPCGTDPLNGRCAITRLNDWHVRASRWCETPTPAPYDGPYWKVTIPA